jgi:DNA primase catalytic core
VARIKDESVERVKAAMEIVPLVEDVVRLRKAGSTYKGLCPFHQERTPSFTVSPARGTFKCFGCGEGGDAITFVEKTENVDFVGAIELLARRFGVELEYEEASPEQEQKRQRDERLRALLERAAEFYSRVLWDSDAGAPAREYLASRGLEEEVCREFRLGYAPGGNRLASRALQEGYTQDELRAVGLGNRRGNDYFQRRIVFPLADARGRVRGFQARKLHDDDPLQAKYVNSPEGELFRKGDLLYGLDTARLAIAREDRAVVVEGNTDVLALRQAGFAPVVASMGTALTEAQLRELARLTKRLFLCFDSDAAGQDATLRGMDLAVAETAMRQGFIVRVVPLSPGTDPADDPAAFRERLAAPVSYPVHRVRLLIESAADREGAWNQVLVFLNALPDSPEHLEARRLATDLLDLPPEMQALLAPGRRSSSMTSSSPRVLDAGTRLERSALAGVAAHESLLPDLELLGPEHFDDELHRRARAYLLGQETADAALTALLAELFAMGDEEELTLETATQLLLRLRERAVQRELAGADGERLVELQQRLSALRDEIRAFA